jgi:hypothetical protein
MRAPSRRHMPNAHCQANSGSKPHAFVYHSIAACNTGASTPTVEPLRNLPPAKCAMPYESRPPAPPGSPAACPAFTTTPVPVPVPAPAGAGASASATPGCCATAASARHGASPHLLGAHTEVLPARPNPTGHQPTPAPTPSGGRPPSASSACCCVPTHSWNQLMPAWPAGGGDGMPPGAMVPATKAGRRVSATAVGTGRGGSKRSTSRGKSNEWGRVGMVTARQDVFVPSHVPGPGKCNLPHWGWVSK